VDILTDLYPNPADISIKKIIQDFPIGAKLVFPLGLIVNELMTNAMKYAFVGRKKGNLCLQLSEDSGRLKLLIADDGIGFPSETQHSEGQGFGCMLVEMLVKQIQGTMTVEKNGGTKYMIECALK
jgi:two-component sensor histidine kinase